LSKAVKSTCQTLSCEAASSPLLTICPPAMLSTVLPLPASFSATFFGSTLKMASFFQPLS
jgi:hypothetical protein